MTYANEPVYPQETRTSHHAEMPDTLIEGGLSKREYFAAKAMQGFLSMYASSAITPQHEFISFKSVVFADALIAELNKKDEKNDK